MFTISKKFDFCYGHRVWSQELNSKFSLDSCLACRHLHGHQGLVEVFLKSDELNEGMVTDFKHLNWFKKWLDDTLDHKFIIDQEDPLFTTLLPHYPPHHKGLLDDRYYHYDEFSNCWFPKRFTSLQVKDEIVTLSKAQVEMYEGFVIVPFVPTSENLSKWLFNLVSDKMKELGVIVQGVQFNETPKSQSTYHI